MCKMDHISYELGPINSKLSFAMACVIDSVPYILNETSVTGGIVYYWESNMYSIVSNNNVPVFFASEKDNAITLSDVANDGYMGFRSSNKNTIGFTTYQAPINISQSSYAPWNAPTIFLSEAVYTIYDNTGVTATVLTSNLTDTILANNILLLPMVLYYGCNSVSGTSHTINGTYNIFTNWFCLFNSDTLPFSCKNSGITGWTTMSDCLEGVAYSYCPSDTICGTDNCKGPCPGKSDTCTYNNSTYSCTFNPQNVPNSYWWSSYYFIITLIGLAFLTFIVIFILIFVYLSKGLSPKSNPDST